MAEIDEIKEQIGSLKTYQGFIVALFISVGAGVMKLFVDETFGFAMWLGIITIVILSFVFILLAKKIHMKIRELRRL